MIIGRVAADRLDGPDERGGEKIPH